jgi:hypothetical protein
MHGTMYSSIEARVKFLQEHPNLQFLALDSEFNVLDKLPDEHWKRIVRAFKHAGLISPTTYWHDVNVPMLLKLVRSR